jgi:protein SCO1/2
VKLNRLSLTLALLALLTVLVAASFAAQHRSQGAGVALIGGPFHLVDDTGKAADDSVLKGHWNAVFFGYTQCPDICPGTLQALSAAADVLGPARAKGLQVVFVSIDPEHDTPPVLKAYLDSQKLPVPVVGLTGTPQQVKAAADAYRVFYVKAPQAGGGYTMSHSTAVYLMDRAGKFSRVLAYGMTPAEMAGQINDAMSGA